MNPIAGASSSAPARVARVEGWQSREADSEAFVGKSAIQMLVVVLSLLSIALAFQWACR
jgi:hypothetical protein